MLIEFEHNGCRYKSDLSQGKSLAIELDFNGPQPSYFGAPAAKCKPLELGGFVGDTNRGGSCNLDDISFVPHCNGTHTETVGHIVDDDVFVGQVVPCHPVLSLLITVAPVPYAETREVYRPPLEKSDRVITAAALKTAVDGRRGIEALMVRTTPNPDSKKIQVYEQNNQPAFLTVEAMKFIVSAGVKHLLVDLPSVDRMSDEGLLSNHHLFWNVAQQTHRLSAECWRNKTISEMIFVPDAIEDGFYLLSIQVPAFCNDAAPSRPFIYAISEL